MYSLNEKNEKKGFLTLSRYLDRSVHLDCQDFLATALLSNKFLLVTLLSRHLSHRGSKCLLSFGWSGFHYEDPEERDRGGHDGHGGLDRAPNDNFTFMV